jgi:putative flippase GtrA
MARDTFQKLVKFYSLAILNTIIGISTLLLFNLLFGSEFALGNILLSNVIVQLVAHYITRRFIWASRSPYFLELLKFSATYFPSFVFSMVCFFSISMFAGMNYVLVQVISSAVFSIFAFFSQKLIVFRAGKN